MSARYSQSVVRSATRLARTLARTPAGELGKRVLPLRYNIMLQYYHSLGEFPHLQNPRTLNEKIQYRKLHERDPRIPPLTDKLTAKQLVADTIGAGWIIPTLWSGTNPADIPFDILAPPYVVKATHASKCNLFVRNLEDVDPSSIQAITTNWLKIDYSKVSYEWAYSQLEPRLIIEPYLGDVSLMPIDYKLLVFHGHVHYIEVCIERGTCDEAWACFDRKWNRHDAYTDWPDAGMDLVKPKNLQRMIDAAEALACDFDFARVDLYEVHDLPLFGEITFYPEGGYSNTYKPEYMNELGKLWQL